MLHLDATPSVTPEQAREVLRRVRDDQENIKTAIEAVGITRGQLSHFRVKNPEYDERLKGARETHSDWADYGAPAKMTKEMAGKILELIRAGNGVMQSVREAEIAYETWRKYRKAHPKYDELVKQARFVQIQMIEDSLYQAAVADGDTTAAIFLLINRTRDLPRDHPMKYQDVKKVITELGGPDEGPIEIRTMEVRPPEDMDEEDVERDAGEVDDIEHEPPEDDE